MYLLKEGDIFLMLGKDRKQTWNLAVQTTDIYSS